MEEHQYVSKLVVHEAWRRSLLLQEENKDKGIDDARPSLDTSIINLKLLEESIVLNKLAVVL
jgi:hypothetical protein